jgi:RNA polymerase sigma-70 factor (ECF subfamily)
MCKSLWLFGFLVGIASGGSSGGSSRGGNESDGGAPLGGLPFAWSVEDFPLVLVALLAVVAIAAVVALIVRFVSEGALIEGVVRARQGGRMWPFDTLFIVLSSRLSGDAERLPEEVILTLVEQARAGDTGARHRLYTQHVDLVYRTVRGILHSDADAEDVTQDALLTVLTSLGGYRPRTDARFSTWITTVAINTARRRFRRRRPERTATGELPDMSGEAIDPAADLDRRRQRRALLNALGELPERDRTIVSLRYGAELNASEIATVVGSEPAAIRKSLERTRARLGTRIEVLMTTGDGPP